MAQSSSLKMLVLLVIDEFGFQRCRVKMERVVARKEPWERRKYEYKKLSYRIYRNYTSAVHFFVAKLFSIVVIT